MHRSFTYIFHINCYLHTVRSRYFESVERHRHERPLSWNGPRNQSLWSEMERDLTWPAAVSAPTVRRPGSGLFLSLPLSLPLPLPLPLPLSLTHNQPSTSRERRGWRVFRFVHGPSRFWCHDAPPQVGMERTAFRPQTVDFDATTCVGVSQRRDGLRLFLV